MRIISSRRRRRRPTPAGGGGGSFADPDLGTWDGSLGYDWLANYGGFGAAHSIEDVGGNPMLRRLLPIDGAGNDPDPAAGTYSNGQCNLPVAGNYTSVYWSTRMRWTNRHTSILKGLRYIVRDGASGYGGNYADNGVIGFGTDSLGSAVKIAIGLFIGSQEATCPGWDNAGYTTYAQNLDGSFFKLMTHYDLLGPGNTTRARFWFAADGATEWTPIVQPPGSAWASDNYAWGPAQDVNNPQWINGAVGEPSWLTWPGQIGGLGVGGIRIFDQLNATNTVEAVIHVDKFQLSTNPISPTL